VAAEAPIAVVAEAEVFFPSQQMLSPELRTRLLLVAARQVALLLVLPELQEEIVRLSAARSRFLRWAAAAVPLPVRMVLQAVPAAVAAAKVRAPPAVPAQSDKATPAEQVA
jgi:hypothetical protein